MKRMTNKEKVKAYFKEEHHNAPVEASQVAQELNLKRNAASALLNELVREGILKKKKTKPVMFSMRKEEKEKPEKENRAEEDVFKEVAGQSYHMEQVLNQCKISATYPGRGIPIILLGQSGVGKSMLAEKIYLYAKQQGKISSKAPFMVLNCADYANNKELLSSVLFGYKKGAFTGADKDKKGLFEQADHGYLFLDEVHRLPPEGQEKLFRYIDTGKISPLGDNTEGLEVNVRLIFATTENVDHALLETFTRRIPIVVNMPPYSERSSNEKMKIIQNLFYREAITLDCNLEISSNVIHNLLSFHGKGNIGTLKNIIKISCANAYRKQRKNTGILQIRMQDLDVNYFVNDHMLKNGSSSGWIYIRKDTEDAAIQNLDPVDDVLKLDETIQLTEKFLEGKINRNHFYKQIKKIMEEVTDYIVYELENSSLETIYSGSVENVFKFIQSNYGFEYTGTSVILITKLMVMLNRNTTFLSEEKKERIHNLEKSLQKRLFRQFKIAELFYEMINQTTDYDANEESLGLFLTLYLFCNMRREKNMCNGIIISHGYSTASSMASLANRVYSTYIFDAFDMPYDTSKKQIVERVRKYLEKIDTSEGVLILVDTGSILDIADDLKDLSEGNLGVINNVTTQMVLEFGNRMMRNQDMEAMLKSIVKYNSTTYRFIRNKEKEKAILVCCGSGVGVAAKICNLLRECFCDQKIKIIEYEHGKLLKKGRDCKVFDLYNVLLVISTMGLEIGNIDVLPLNELIDSEGYDVLNRVLSPFCSKKEIAGIIENIIKKFSMKNIMNQLTILNPEILMNDVGNVIHFMEREMKIQFPPDLKQLLYMHIGIMVERLIQERDNVSINTFQEFSMCHNKFCKMLKKAVFVMENRYHVSVNTREMKLIYDMIVEKTGNLKEYEDL